MWEDTDENFYDKIRGQRLVKGYGTKQLGRCQVMAEQPQLVPKDFTTDEYNKLKEAGLQVQRDKQLLRKVVSKTLGTMRMEHGVCF